MKRKRIHIFLLIPLLFIFVFSWTQGSGTVLCVSDSQTHYVKRNPLRMMACHSSAEDKAHQNRHADTQALNLDPSACTEILLASANSIRQPEKIQFTAAATFIYSWPATNLAPYLPSVIRRSPGAYFQKNHLDPSLRSLRTTVLLI